MHGVDVHGRLEPAAHDLDPAPPELVGAVDAQRLPVGPVEVVFEQGQRERMW